MFQDAPVIMIKTCGIIMVEPSVIEEYDRYKRESLGHIEDRFSPPVQIGSMPLHPGGLFPGWFWFVRREPEQLEPGAAGGAGRDSTNHSNELYGSLWAAHAEGTDE